LLGLLLLPIMSLFAVAIWLNHRNRLILSKLIVLLVANTANFAYLVLFGLAGEVTVFFANVTLPLNLSDLEERAVILFGFTLSIAHGVTMVAASNRRIHHSLLSVDAAHWLS